MNVKKKYLAVVKEWGAKNYDAALKLLYKMQTRDKDFYYIEAAIYYGLKNYIKVYRILKKLLPLLPRSSPEDKKNYDECLLLSTCVQASTAGGTSAA